MATGDAGGGGGGAGAGAGADADADAPAARGAPFAEGFLRVDLHPMLVQDEPTALTAIASQLRVLHAHMQPRGSFCDGLRYILHLLRRARPGGLGDAATEGQSQPVIFVLHAFEQFCNRPKQTLLYSLFDLMQTEDAQMAVVRAPRAPRAPLPLDTDVSTSARARFDGPPRGWLRRARRWG